MAKHVVAEGRSILYFIEGEQQGRTLEAGATVPADHGGDLKRLKALGDIVEVKTRGGVGEPKDPDADAKAKADKAAKAKAAKVAAEKQADEAKSAPSKPPKSSR